MAKVALIPYIFYFLGAISKFSWHDSYRILQVFLIIISFIILLINKKHVLFERYNQKLVFLFFVIGYFSSALSQRKIFALLETSLFVGLYSIYICIVEILEKQDVKDVFDEIFLFVVPQVFVLCFYFFLNYIFSITVSHRIDFNEITPFFDNPRFMGQILTMLAPIFASFLIIKNNKFLNTLFFLLWAVIVLNGTRGTWYSLAFLTIFFCFFNKLGVEIAKKQVIGLFWGVFFAFCMSWLIPMVLNFDLGGSPVERLNLSLSSREIIWLQSLCLIKENPFLGVGPMHFSGLNSIAGAHPHQLFLQIASEWGIPALIILIILIIKSFIPVLKNLRVEDEKISVEKVVYLGLVSSVTASLLQSMVDGVFVMPLTQTFLTIVMALLTVLHRKLYLAPYVKSKSCLDIYIYISCSFFLL